MTSHQHILPPLTRFVTDHDEQGRSCHVRKSDVSPEVLPGITDIMSKVLWTTEETPADNSGPFQDPLEQGFSGGIANERGTTVRVIDFMPGTSDIRLHRTNSIDYGIVVSGSIFHSTEDGDEIEAKAGDVFVQRGTAHAWNNKSKDTICRMVFVLVGAQPVKVNGKELGEMGFDPNEFVEQAK